MSRYNAFGYGFYGISTFVLTLCLKGKISDDLAHTIHAFVVLTAVPFFTGTDLQFVDLEGATSTYAAKQVGCLVFGAFVGSFIIYTACRDQSKRHQA